jgi:26S proteasome regulatory subunit N6
VKEVKKIDDKLLMVEIELIASRVHHALQNIPAAKGALTAARSAANSIYCPPLLQAEIDLQAGTLCGEEKDYKTAFSYFYEAFEGYNTVSNPAEAVRSLKYMLLSKVMLNLTADVYAIINGKIGIKYAGIEVEAMKAIADALRDRSIHKFGEVNAKYKAQLQDDPIVQAHLRELYDNLLEQNLIRIIEPFSRVQIPHVAKLINLSVRQVEDKLSEMILDQKFHGILDQGSGDLIVFDDIPADKTFEASLDTVKELGSVVDKLYRKATKLRQAQ